MNKDNEIFYINLTSQELQKLSLKCILNHKSQPNKTYEKSP